MNHITFGEAWLENIEFDIEKKYNVKYPRFAVEGKVAAKREDLIDWVDECLWNSEDPSEPHWVKYKHVSGDLFNLKCIEPDPPVDVCKKIVQEYIDFVKEKTPNPYFKIGKKIFDEGGAKKELVGDLQDGYSIIEHYFDLYPDPEPDKNRVIYNVYFGQDEIDCELDKGFLILEDTTKD